MTSLKDIKTRADEIPLIYSNPMTQNCLIITWFVDDRKKKVPNKYVFAEQNQKGDVVRQGVLKGLKQVNEFRNDIIRNGWRFFHMPKNIDIRKADGTIIPSSSDPVPEPPKENKPRVKKSTNYGVRKRNPAETFEEMKKRISQN